MPLLAVTAATSPRRTSAREPLLQPLVSIIGKEERGGESRRGWGFQTDRKMQL